MSPSLSSPSPGGRPTDAPDDRAPAAAEVPVADAAADAPAPDAPAAGAPDAGPTHPAVPASGPAAAAGEASTLGTPPRASPRSPRPPRSAAADGRPSAVGALPGGQRREALVAEVVRALAVLPDRARLAVALSGGPDSTALAHLVCEARPDLAVTLVHIRHGLRDDREDLELVRQHADWLGVPLLIREVVVQRRGRGTEAAAREARYAALREVATSIRARAVAVGHTADDQAETVLLRAARGTGIAGLAAMAAAGDDLIRPLLRLRRGDVARFLLLEGLPAAQDPTNRDPHIRRVAVRYDVLPTLDRVAGDAVGALTRLADLSREDAAALDGWAAEVVAGRVRRLGPVHLVADAEVASLPPAVARRVVRAVLLAAAPGQPPPSAATVSRILDLGAGQAVDLPHGLRATAGGGWRAVSPRELPVAPPRSLAWPGATAWTPIGVRVTVVVPEPDAGQLALALPGAWSPPSFRADAGLVPPGGHRDRLAILLPTGVGPLWLRHRAPGDRVRTAVGTQRLAELYIDAGIPRPLRALWPVVATETGRVLWVPGVAADADVLAAGRREPAAQLRLEPDRGGSRR